MKNRLLSHFIAFCVLFLEIGSTSFAQESHRNGQRPLPWSHRIFNHTNTPSYFQLRVFPVPASTQVFVIIGGFRDRPENYSNLIHFLQSMGANAAVFLSPSEHKDFHSPQGELLATQFEIALQMLNRFYPNEGFVILDHSIGFGIGERFLQNNDFLSLKGHQPASIDPIIVHKILHFNPMLSVYHCIDRSCSRGRNPTDPIGIRLKIGNLKRSRLTPVIMGTRAELYAFNSAFAAIKRDPLKIRAAQDIETDIVLAVDDPNPNRRELDKYIQRLKPAVKVNVHLLSSNPANPAINPHDILGRIYEEHYVRDLLENSFAPRVKCQRLMTRLKKEADDRLNSDLEAYSWNTGD
ncbi:MAG: hypothetical protein J0L93_01870 [Deltaproteobacteria bacterium]|nr:hypothetical protein [Deltaproteobacteria bacterium]